MRLLLDSAPFSNVDPELLAQHEDAIAAWQLDIGHELASENIPLSHVVLVVEGTLRVSGRDALGNPFTLRRVHPGDWWGLWGALSGVSAATCRTTETTKLLSVPVELFQDWFSNSSKLSKWLESHPQREDFYATLRPLLAELPRQDRSFLDSIDQLQGSMRAVQLYDSLSLHALLTADSGVSWLSPSAAFFLRDLPPVGSEGIAISSLERALERSPSVCVLLVIPQRLYKKLLIFRLLLLPQVPSLLLMQLLQKRAMESSKSCLSGRILMGKPCSLLLFVRKRVDLPETLKGFRSNRSSVIACEQGLALLQMICEALRLPFVATSSTACSRAWWAISQAPPLRILAK